MWQAGVGPILILVFVSQYNTIAQTTTNPTTPQDFTRPTNPTTPQDFTRPTNPTTPQDFSRPTNPTTPQDFTRPTNPTTPQEFTRPTNPTTPQDFTRPTNPTTSQDFTRPTNPTTLQDFTRPTNPTPVHDFTIRTTPNTRCEASFTPTPFSTPVPPSPFDGVADFPPNIPDLEFNSQERLNLYQTLTVRYFVPKAQALTILRANRPPVCSLNLTCNEDRTYRSYDGTCNNLKNPRWGSAFRNFNRLISASYPDGYNQMNNPWQWSWPPATVPSARMLSIALTGRDESVKEDVEVTNMLTQFGQFVDHDMTFTPRQDQVCCTNGWNCGGDNIEISNNDYFYANISSPRQWCLDFSRSTIFCFPTETGVREQFNALSSYLDASHVYGSTAQRGRQLRLFSKGKLRTNCNNNILLPTIQEVEMALGISLQLFSYTGQQGLVGKFFAGDDRVNQNPGLTVLHTLFVREHNRLADKIGETFPSWKDEQIYQEARKIVVAEWQNIVYSEYLPIILGPASMTKYSLNIGKTFTVYKPTADATAYNSFATAAFRFGHSMVDGLVQMVNGLRLIGVYLLRDNFFDSSQIEQENGVVNIMGGLITQNALAMDQTFTQDLTNYLFKEKSKNFGSDLLARNIQRGRDHGLPSYNAYRKFCGLHPLSADWTDKPNEISKDAWTKLQNTDYNSPLDIELYVGGVSEDSLPGGVVGATFNCIQAKQFQKAQDGDRFFFSHKDQIASLTSNQLATIRRRTLGDIICDNVDIPSVTLNVFKIPSRRGQLERQAKNPLVPVELRCQSIVTLN